MNAITQAYAEEAAMLSRRYDALNFLDKHAVFRRWLPDAPRVVLDIGAGSGADAAWLAEQGHRVVAVEPVAEFRNAAQARHPSARIEWLDDQLPSLQRVRDRDHGFDLVLLSAVWMHLDLAEREEAMAHLATVLAPAAVLLLTLRHGSVPQGRRMFEVSPEEVMASAQRHGLLSVFHASGEPLQAANRQQGVTWSRLVFRQGG